MALCNYTFTLQDAQSLGTERNKASVTFERCLVYRSYPLSYLLVDDLKAAIRLACARGVSGGPPYGLKQRLIDRLEGILGPKNITGAPPAIAQRPSPVAHRPPIPTPAQYPTFAFQPQPPVSDRPTDPKKLFDDHVVPAIPREARQTWNLRGEHAARVSSGSPYLSSSFSLPVPPPTAPDSGSESSELLGEERVGLVVIRGGKPIEPSFFTAPLQITSCVTGQVRQITAQDKPAGCGGWIDLGTRAEWATGAAVHVAWWMGEALLALVVARRVPVPRLLASLYTQTAAPLLPASTSAVPAIPTPPSALPAAISLYESALPGLVASALDLRKCKVEVDDVATGDETLAFRCPLSLARVVHPAKGSRCIHTECFDAETFLEYAVNTGEWRCVVGSCSKVLSLDDMRIDPLFYDLLRKYPNEDKCIVHASGTSSPPATAETIPQSPSPPPAFMTGSHKRRRLDSPVIDLDGDDVIPLDVEDENEGRVARRKRPSNAPVVVDLCDSDDEVEIVVAGGSGWAAASGDKGKKVDMRDGRRESMADVTIVEAGNDSQGDGDGDVTLHDGPVGIGDPDVAMGTNLATGGPSGEPAGCNEISKNPVAGESDSSMASPAVGSGDGTVPPGSGCDLPAESGGNVGVVGRDAGAATGADVPAVSGTEALSGSETDTAPIPLTDAPVVSEADEAVVTSSGMPTETARRTDLNSGEGTTVGEDAGTRSPGADAPMDVVEKATKPTGETVQVDIGLPANSGAEESARQSLPTVTPQSEAPAATAVSSPIEFSLASPPTATAGFDCVSLVPNVAARFECPVCGAESSVDLSAQGSWADLSAPPHNCVGNGGAPVGTADASLHDAFFAGRASAGSEVIFKHPRRGWLLTSVVSFLQEKNKYLLNDLSGEGQQIRFIVPTISLVPLPPPPNHIQSPSADLPSHLPPWTHVLALSPSASKFVLATTVATFGIVRPGEYTVNWGDTRAMGQVEERYVIAMPQRVWRLREMA